MARAFPRVWPFGRYARLGSAVPSVASIAPLCARAAATSKTPAHARYPLTPTQRTCCLCHPAAPNVGGLCKHCIRYSAIARTTVAYSVPHQRVSGHRCSVSPHRVQLRKYSSLQKAILRLWGTLQMLRARRWRKRCSTCELPRRPVGRGSHGRCHRPRAAWASTCSIKSTKLTATCLTRHTRLTKPASARQL